MLCPGTSDERHDRLHGYFYPSKGNTIGVNLTRYKPNTPESDYTLAHELTHLLLARHVRFERAAGSLSEISREHGQSLEEGAATFYGNLVTQVIHPDFNIRTHPAFKGPYKDGFEFFAAVATAVGDPLTIISAHPLLTCMVPSHMVGEYQIPAREGFAMDHPDLYIRNLELRTQTAA
jgi:hypothetical protein